MFNQQDHLQWSKSQLTLYSPPLSIGKPMCFTSAFCHLHCNVLSGVTEQSDIYMIYEVSRRKKTFLSCEYIFFNSLNYLNQPRWRALILLLRNSRCPRHKTKCQSVCLCMHIHKMITAQVSPWRSGGEGVKFTLSQWGEGTRIKNWAHTWILAHKIAVLRQSWKMTGNISATTMTSKGNKPYSHWTTRARSLLLATWVAEQVLSATHCS